MLIDLINQGGRKGILVVGITGLISGTPSYAAPAGTSTATTSTPATTSAATTLPAAATPAPIKIGDWTVTGSWRTRVEGWNWFDAPGFDDDYSFAHSFLRIGIGRQ
jgi:hypothetical protein